MPLVAFVRKKDKMAENKAKIPTKGQSETVSRHGKRAEERRHRQAEALRANLKKRKDQVRGREVEE